MTQTIKEKKRSGITKIQKFHSGSSGIRLNTSRTEQPEKDTYECRNASKPLWTFVQNSESQNPSGYLSCENVDFFIDALTLFHSQKLMQKGDGSRGNVRRETSRVWLLDD